LKEGRRSRNQVGRLSWNVATMDYVRGWVMKQEGIKSMNNA